MPEAPLKLDYARPGGHNRRWIIRWVERIILTLYLVLLASGFFITVIDLSSWAIHRIVRWLR